MNKTKKINRSKHLKKETEIKTERRKVREKGGKTKNIFFKKKTFDIPPNAKMFFSQ